MLGKTHMTVGIAVTMAVTQPETITELLLAAGVGAVGALISDIDVGTSESHREADKITMISAVVLLIVLVLDCFFQTGIIRRIVQSSGYARMAAGTLLFIGTCAFGKEQPHRSFMHSFLALALLSFAVALVWEKAAVYFAVGFLSHLALDIFNKKKVRLWYPLKGGAALGLCRANSLVNRVLFVIGSAAAAAETALCVLRIFSII